MREDLRLADDHRVQPGGDPEQMRRRRRVGEADERLATHLARRKVKERGGLSRGIAVGRYREVCLEAMAGDDEEGIRPAPREARETLPRVERGTALVREEGHEAVAARRLAL